MDIPVFHPAVNLVKMKVFIEHRTVSTLYCYVINLLPGLAIALYKNMINVLTIAYAGSLCAYIGAILFCLNYDKAVI